MFSSTIVIQYEGREREQHGAYPASIDGQRVDQDISLSTLGKFPLMQFRIVNTSANEKDSEILNANVSCLVCINSTLEASPKEIYISNKDAEKMILDYSTDVKEGVPLFKQVYHQFLCNTMTHPHFRRIWYLNHVLDGNSPILKPEMKSIINRCGHWPSGCNTYKAVRNSLIPFHAIIVNFRGTSNVVNSDVCEKKIYFYEVSS